MHRLGLPVVAEASLQRQLSWEELREIVGATPPSDVDRSQWWQGDCSHTRARRAAGFEITRAHLRPVRTPSRR